MGTSADNIRAIITAAIELDPESADKIRAGSPFVCVMTQAPGNGREVRVRAYSAVRGTDGTVYSACPDFRSTKLRASRNFSATKMASWWASKCFGEGVPVEHKTLI